MPMKSGLFSWGMVTPSSKWRRLKDWPNTLFTTIQVVGFTSQTRLEVSKNKSSEVLKWALFIRTPDTDQKSSCLFKRQAEFAKGIHCPEDNKGPGTQGRMEHSFVTSVLSEYSFGYLSPNCWSLHLLNVVPPGLRMSQKKNKELKPIQTPIQWSIFFSSLCFFSFLLLLSSFHQRSCYDLFTLRPDLVVDLHDPHRH